MKLKPINGKPRNAFGKILNRKSTYHLLSWLRFEYETLVTWDKGKSVLLADNIQA